MDRTNNRSAMYTRSSSDKYRLDSASSSRAIDLALWIVYVIIDSDIPTWIAFRLLLVSVVLGEVMILRWRHSRKQAAPEARFPIAVIYGHGLLASTTIVLVLLTAAGIDGYSNIPPPASTPKRLAAT
jgi:hypothetical protein